MNLKQFLLRNLFWQGLYAALAFALNLLMARKFGASINGHLNYLQFIFSIIILTGGISLESGLIYFGASGKIKKHSPGWFALLWSVFITALLAFVFYGTRWLDKGDLNLWFIWCLLYTGGYLLINNFSALFYAYKKVITPNAIKAVITVALILFLTRYDHLYGEFWTNEFLWLYFISFMIMGLLIMLSWFIHTRKERPFFSFPRSNELASLLRYSLFAMFINLIFFFVYRIDYWFVEKYCSEQSLGNYTQVSKWVQYFQMLPVFLSAALFPAAASGMLDENVQQLKRLNRMMFWLYLFLLLPLIAVSPWIFIYLYGSTYSEMSIPFLLLAPGILALSVIALLSAYFAGINKMKINLEGNLLALVLIIAGNILFTKQYGIKAAALTSSLAYFVFLTIIN
jgi:O-antigen/teichoic acid export membrane protein